MELFELLQRRRSVRRFQPREVSRTTIERLIAATLTAPSSRNCRSTRLMVVRESGLLAQAARMRDYGADFLSQAPLAILVLGDTELTDLWVDNCAISATILQLAAEELGLGSCWVHVNGRPREKEHPEGESAEAYLRSFLPIPASWRPLCFIALGYPDQMPHPRSEKDDSNKVIWA